MPFLKDDDSVREARLSPPDRYSDLPEAEDALVALGNWYNRIGGLVEHLASRFSVDPSLVLALWYLDRGDVPATSGGPELRVEFNLLFKHWGKEHLDIFDRHFRFGSHNDQPGAAWQNHSWRPDEDSEWRDLHVGSQKREYEAFLFIEELAGKEAACRASRLTELRLDGAEFAKQGYKSAAALFAAIRSSERWQICAFFEILQATQVLPDLVAGDWSAMARKRAEFERPPAFLRRFFEAKSAAEELAGYPRLPLDRRQLETTEELYSLNLSRGPQIKLFNAPKPAPVLAVLSEGNPLRKLRAHAEQPDWWFVEATLDAASAKGWVESADLQPGAPMSPAWPKRARLPASHLGRQGQMRSSAEGRCYPLNEEGMPTRSATEPAERREQLGKIANYLDPANSEHLRYMPSEEGNHVEAYAYDFCALARVFIPRVWWRDPALLALGAGDMPHVIKDTTVKELNANGLYDWFRAFGPDYGWTRFFQVGELQRAANQGRVGLIIARSRSVNAAGHVSLVVPEREGVKAFRKAKKVLRPVESQAGQPLGPSKKRWWLDDSYAEFSFWVHD
ncbi:MAG: N-acetylmuramidase domain-containing protein [Kiloniellales bacterium]